MNADGLCRPAKVAVHRGTCCLDSTWCCSGFDWNERDSQPANGESVHPSHTGWCVSPPAGARLKPMVVKITRVEKYNNPCLRGLLVSGAALIWFACVFPILRIALPLGSWASAQPLPESLQRALSLALGAGPVVLWVYSFPVIATALIAAFEWLWATSQPVSGPLGKRIKRRIKGVYETIVELNNRW